MNYDNPDLRDRLAAEYALGTLRGLARRRFERMMESDRALQQQVEAWELRLNRLAETAPAIAPPARVWQRVSQRLGIPEAKRRSLWSMLFGGASVRIPGLAESGLWNFVDFWRPAALATAAAAVALAIYIASTVPVAAPITHIAVLNDQSNKPALVANLQAADNRLVVRSVLTAPAGAGKVHELWLLPPGESAPVSLGLLTAGETIIQLSLGSAGALVNGGLAVSLEPAGGSPTGLPTGPVLFAGPMLPAGT
jgi:anti-sigma-K factor RskA